MTQHNNEVSVRTLGIYMSPTLNWYRQFKELRIKMQEYIGKLSNTIMTIQLTHLHVNSHFISKVYFGCGIMDMIDSQDK